MSKTLLRAIFTAAVLIAAHPGAAFATSVDLNIYSMNGSPDPITLGTGNVTYTVGINNASTTSGTNVVLTNTLPASSTYVSSSATGSGTCSQSGSTVTCSWSSLPTGSFYSATIIVTPTAAGALTLSSSVSGTESDPNTLNNSASKAVIVNSQIDLGISSMSVSPDPITLGTGDVQYFVQFTNNSTSQATNVVLSSTIPASSTFVSATTPVGSGSCSQSAGTVTCNWASIGASQSYYAYITVTPTAGGVLTLSSSVSATQSDPNTANNSGSKAVTVNSQIDLWISNMSVTPDPMTLGTGDVQYLVQFTNASTSQATNPVLTSTIPAGSTFVSATTPFGSGSCSQSAGTVTCNWPTIGASSTLYAYITVTPTAAGSLVLTSTISATQSDPNTSNNSSSKAVTVNSQIDLGLSSMSVSPDPITLGTGDVQFFVQFSNSSTSQATNVVLTSTIPVNSTFVSATTPFGSGSCSQSAGTVTCNWPSIGPGSSYYAYITVTPTAGGALTLSSTVSATQTDPNTSNNSGSKAVTVNSQIDLGFSSMSVSPDPITLGTGDVQFFVQFSNGSTSQATNVVLTSTLPTNSTFVSATTPVGSGTCSHTGTTVTCNWSTIGASSSYYAYITVTPTAGGSLTLTSTVSAAQSDPNTSNNTASKASTVNSAIDLSISSITGSPDPITLGSGNELYTVYVYNNSSSQATNAVLTCTLPSSSTFVSATTPVGSGTCSQSAGTVTCNWASIGPGSNYYAYITVTPTANGVMTLSASVTGAQTDPNATNNSASKGVTVGTGGTGVDLQLYNISGTPDPITLGGGNVTYTVQVYNSNNTTASTSTVLTNTLPSNSTYVSSSATNSGTCTQSGSTVTCNWSSIPASNSYFVTIVVTPTSGGALTLSASVAGAETDPNTANNTASKSTTVNSQIDLQVYNVSGTPDPITLNTGNVTYSVQVYNATSSQGTNIVLTNTLPSNSTYVSSSATNSGTCSQSGGTVTCNWTSIAASNSYFATIVVTPTSGGPLTLTASVAGTESDSNSTNNTASKTVTVNSQIDLQVYSVGGTPDPITLNTGNVTYTVQVYNASSSQGTNIVLTNTLPSNSTYVSSSASNSGTCTQSAGTVTCNWTSISAFNSYVATIVVTPTSGGPLALTASVTGTESDSNTANNTASKSVTVNSQIDLQLYSVSATPDPITLSTGNVTYSVQVYNSSSSQGTNTVLTNTLPSNSTYVSSSASNSGTCTQSAGTVTCNWTSISAFNSYFVTIVVTPTAGGPMTLSASVAGTEGDSNTSNNTASKSVTVNSQIDLQLYSINATPDPITLNTGNVTYTVNVYNTSTSQGTNTVLTNTLPANSTYVSSAASNSGTCTHSGSTVTCNWSSIPANGFYTVTIVVTPTAGGAMTLASSVSGAESDSNTSNNSGSKSVTINSQIDLQLYSISATPDPITLNTGNVTYTVNVYNATSSQGTNTVLTNTLPTNSTFVSATATNSGTCTQSGGTATCNWSSITGFGFYSVTIVVTPTAGGPLAISSSVSGTEGDSNTANNNANKAVTVNDKIDLKIYSINGSPDPITFGAGDVTFNSYIYNQTGSQGTNVVLTNTLPSNSTYVSSSASSGGSCLHSGSTVTCTWASVPAFSVYSSTMVVTPTTPGTLTLSASVTGTQPDPNTADNTGSLTTAVAPTSCTAVPSGAVTWYRAENNGVDSAGPNFATLTGGATYTTGKAGQAFSFDGLNDSVNAPMSPSLQLTTGATVEFWMKGDPSNALNTCCQGLVATDMYAVEIAGGGIHWGLSTDNGATQPFPSSGQVAISTNQWHHIAGTYDGSTIALYIDGALASSTAHTGTISSNSGFLSIGSEDGRTGTCPACVGTRYYKGLIDEVTIYDRALSAAEIQAIFGAGTFGKCYAAAAAPTITGFTPSSGNTGSSVVITGTNFTAVSSVNFNGVPATFAGNSSSQITATVPGAATTGTISIVAGGGSVTSATAFTVATAVHWINSSGGNWNTGSNWSGGSVPTASNDVVIDAAGTYTVNLDVNPAFNSLTIGGGATGTQTLDLGFSHDVTFTNPGTVTASGAITFATGRLLGAGSLTVNGTMNWISDGEIQTTVTIASGATLNISGSGTRYLNGGTINNSGTVNWTGSNNLSIYNSGVINNLAAGLFSVTNDQLIYQHCCSAAQAFNNAGTFRKSVATGTTTINGNGINNSGTLDVQSGTVTLGSGGTSTGIFNTAAAGTILVSSVYTLGSGATLTGTGNYQLAAGQLSVSAAGVTVNHLTLAGGNLNINSGGSVSTTASGVIDWNADATLSGAGSLNVASGGTLNFGSSGTRYIDGGTLNNSGTINWSGGNNLSVYNSGVINNLTGGLFLATNDQIIYFHCCASGQAFNNAGTFRKTTATGTTSIQSNGFTNSGTVDIQSGTFNLTSGGTSTAVFNAAAAGRVLFNGTAYTLAGAATLTGAGNFEINGGQVNVTGSAISVAHLTMNGGTLNVTGAMSTTSTGVVDWSADAVLTGAGSLTIASAAMMNITGSGTRYINAGTLNNDGTINWSGGNNLSIYNSGVINNHASGLFSVKNDQIIYFHCCASGQAFNNAGTFRKSVATGTTIIQNNGFNNSGTLDVQSGTLNLTSGGTSTGVFNAAASSAVVFSGSAYTLGSGATLTGSGNFQLTGSQLNVSGAGITADHFTLSGGTLNITGSIGTSALGVIDWNGDSTLTGAGSMNISSGGVLNINGSGTRFIDGGTLNNSGTVNWSGGVNISVYSSGVINNAGLFSVTNDQLMYQHCCSAGQPFNNTGTFRKSTATGSTTIQNFTNSGTLQPQSGVISFTGLFTNSGSPTYNFGIGSASTYGRVTFSNPVSLTGALIAAPVNSFVPQGGQQFTIFSFPSGAATFSPKTLTYGSSPVRAFTDSYGATAVTLTAGGPTITTALSPNQGPGTGGTAVTITGTGFVSGGSLGVTFGGTAATGVTFVNSTTITCTTPAHASGVVDVVLTNGDGQPTTATNGFTYDTSPIVTAIRPSSGSVAGTGGVIIEGTNLSTVTAVTFGGSNGTIISSTAAQLVVAAPAHAAGIVNVAVTNPVGTYTITNGFTYINNDDAARDFFVLTNPSSRWSYGYETSRGSAFNLYSSRGNSSGFDYWGAGLPNLGRNSTASPLAQATNLTPSMKLEFHPGASGENSVFRWTAPASGQYRVHGYFVGLDASYPTTTDVAILHNNSTASTLFSTNINSYNVPANFDVTTTFSAGDTAEFTVGFGSNSNYSGDATGLDVTIDPAGAANADVAISGSAPATIATGANFTYTTVVTNNGPAAASNVTATITLPANVTLNGSPSSTQGTCSGTTTITCSIGALSNTSTATQTINLTATGAGTAVLSAAASAAEADPDSSNNSCSSNVAIGGTSSLFVTTNADSGTGSLRQAILDANNNVCSFPCTIAFNLPGGQLTIAPPTSLPALTAANVRIDATTQPGYSGTPLVTLDGSSNPNPSTGLQLSGGNDTVKGLSIVTFQGSAILIDTAGSDTVAANYLGVHTDGSTAGQNAGEGVMVSSANNTIGGTTAAARNVISGNFGSGVVLKSGSATGNTVRGNYIGLTAAGTTNVANHTDGIQILNGASFNTIGGTTAAERNVISGNNNSGIYITSGAANCNGNVISGNFIGTDAAGTTSIGNTTGVFLGALVTSTSIANNTIVSNVKGIGFDGPGTGNAILGNSITGNSGLSIDLANDGSTANDGGDGDTGPNNLQNTPTFVDAALAGGTLTAHVNVDSAAVANTAGLRVELFKSDASGLHAVTFLASQCFAGNALSGAAITVASAPVVVGDKLVATATSYADAACGTVADGTSEFSAAVSVTSCTPPAATITAGGPTTFCTGGSVTLTASAGASYQWRNFATPIVGANAQQYVATTSGSYTVTVTNAGGCSATSSATSVSVNSTVNVTISAGGPTTFCAGGSVTLTANPSGGSGTFASYQWLLNGSPIGGANGTAYNATAAGNYSVTVTDSAGCTGTSAPQSVTVNAPPSAVISAPASTCANTTNNVATVNPAGGATYSWSITNGTISSGQGTSSIVFSAGTTSPVSISVTATLNGCSATGSASVAVGAFTPTITGSNTFCPGGNTTLTSSAGTSYQWSLNGSPIGSANSQTYVANTAGNYTVAVTNGSGCSGTSAPFAVSQAPLATPTITAGGPTTFCAGGSVTLTSSTAATYQWLLNGSPTGNTAQSINVTSSGSYSVTVTSGSCNATSSAVSVTVNAPPSASISAPASTCANTTNNVASVSATGGATYSWSITNGTISSGQGTSSIVFSAGTTSPISISVTATLNGCSATGSASVAVGAFTPTITGSNTFCPGGNTTLTSSAGTSYQWSLNGSPIGSATSQSYVANAAGNYAVAVTNGSGCSGTSAPFAVSQAPLATPTITAGGPTTFCASGSVTLTSSAAATYQWLLNGSPTGNTAQSINATISGSYSVTVTSGSCSATSSPISVTVNPNPTVAITGPASVCAGGSATLDAGPGFATYAWSNGANTQSITVSPASPTTYSVTVTSNGCSASASKTITISSGASTAAITAPSSVPTGSTGNSASVNTAQSGSTYSWTISGGTITSGNGTPSIVWTAGNSGTATIGITITSGSCSASGSVNVAITDSADVALTMTATPNPVNGGGTITFTLNPANNGPSDAQNVTIINSLFGITAATASGNGWTCNVNGLSIICTRPTFAVGAIAPITITAIASGSSAGDDASIGTATSDPNTLNNNASASVAVTTGVSCNNSAPLLLSPSAGASNLASSVNFSWSAVANATSYDLWIASSGAAAAIATTTQSTSATINLPSGPSTWYVAAHFPNGCPTLASAPRDLTVAASPNCTQGAPQLIGPSPNANVTSPVTFSWTAVAQAVGYRLWVAIDGGPIQDAGTTNGATSLTVPLSGSSVVWHVDAIFPGCAPTSSSSSSFTLATTNGCASHAAPSLLAPAPNATVPSSVVDLQWTAAAGASGYRVWASINGADFAAIATRPAAVTTLHFTFTTGSIVWYVEALFDGCASLATSKQSFTIPPAQNCNNSAATPTAPSNNASLTNGFVEFDWSATANAVGYELWLSIDGGTPSLAGSTTATFLRRTVGTGNIEWFVRTLFDRCDPVDSAHFHFNFTPPADCSVARAILTAPVDGAAVVFAPFDLHWSNVPGAAQYKVWLAAGADAPKVIGTTSALHLDNVTASAGPVTWSVEALFDNCPAVRSTASTFTAAAPPPPCSTPDIPQTRAESTASTNVDYVIRWTPAGPKATTQYELQESTDAAFTAPLSITTDASERSFTHTNSGDAPVTYYYRVRAIGTCNGARSLFSLAVAVQVLPSNVTDPSNANGSTPADNPQPTHYELHLGGGSNGASVKGAIAAAAGDTFTATTNQPWLTVSPSSGIVAPEGTTLNVIANTNGLPVGTSTAAVNVTFGSSTGSSTGSSRSIPLGNPPPATTTVSVNLVQPVSPTAKNAPPPDALIIPAVAHANGINSKFQSDVRVTNSSAQPMKYQVTFTPTGDTGITQGKQTTVDIEPGHTIALDDVLESWFGSNGATGTLEVRPLTTTNTSTSAALPTGLANILTFASSRTFNTTLNGTFGQYIPAIPFAAFVGRASDPSKSTILSLQQIAQSSAFRTNLGIVEGSGDPASVLVSVFGDDGKKLTEFAQELKGGQHIQLNSILSQKNVQVNDGRIEVKVVSPVGKVTAYASVLDNLTNDPLLVTPVAVNATAAAKYVIPGIADLNNGFANWQTDVRLFNPSANIVKATLTFYSQGGGAPQSKDVSLAPNQVQTFDSALHQFFGLTNDGGALHISTTATTPLVATARTYNQTSNGTYGQFIPAVTANDAAALGTRPLQLLQIEESDRYRTNVGFAEVTGKAATIEVTAVPSDSKVAASTQINLTPNQFIQYPQLLKSMGLTNMYNARVTVKVISGQGRVTAYASVIDSKTNDPTFVPAQ
jgi:uncharacterized repeat protein (TIGR01451 family)